MEINGHDLINLGITNGKDIGRILKDLYNIIQKGEIKNERHILMDYIGIKSIGERMYIKRRDKNKPN